MSPLKGEVAELRGKVEEVDAVARNAMEIASKAKELAEQPKDSASGDLEWTKRIEDLEKLVAGMSLSGHGGASGVVGVVGGLQDASSPEAAKAWLNQVLQQARIDGVQEIFHKGSNKFNGMLFVKFTSSGKRDAAIGAFNSLRSKFSDKISYMNQDLPVQERVMNSFLLGLKRMLVGPGWEFNKTSVQVDTSAQTMAVQGEIVLKARVKDFKLVLEWIKPEWGAWEEFVKDGQFNTLFQAGQDKLSEAWKRMDKGKGKGPAKGSSA